MAWSSSRQSLTRIAFLDLPFLFLTFLLPVPLASLQQQSRILYVNNADPTCQGQSPCYSTIQAAVDAGIAGDTIRIQAGTYQEQVNISGKNNVTEASEADRITLEADPVAPVGSVILTGVVSQCTNGYAIRLQQSKFITIRGITITGAGGQAISLMGGNNQNQAIHLERNRIFDNGSSQCDGGITIARGNPDTVILNNLIYGNGRNGITFIDADGGPHYLINNTIHSNAWGGVSVARNHEVTLVNNLITGNGTASGSTGGRFGVKREDSTSPQPTGIRLLKNLICGNRLGEIDGPALDATDSNNLTPTGSEGPGVSASPSCEVPANVYANLNGTDGQPNTADDDFSLGSTSPAIDRGMDPRTLGLNPSFNARFEADFSGEARRPRDGNGSGTAEFDLGALEAGAAGRPTISALNPSSGVHGQTLTLTVTGERLGGATALTFRKDGSPDPTITTSNLAPNPEGTQLTASVTLATNAALGARVVTVTTPEGTSDATATSGNTFTVLGQLSLIPDFQILRVTTTGVVTVSASAPAPAGGISVTLMSAAPEITTVTSSVIIPEGATSGSAPLSAVAEGTTSLSASASGFASGLTVVTVSPVPNPATVAPPLNRSVATSVGKATEFLYTGPDPIQTGVAPGAIEAQRAAALRGRVLSRDGTPLSGVAVSILNHPEYGTTLSRADGMFDLAANGGSRLTIQFQKAGYLPAQRPVSPSWQDFAWVPDVVLIHYDTRVTTIDLSAPTPIQVARGNSVTDSDGTRQATLFFAQGTTARIQLPDGTQQPLTTLSVRATEYTVGSNGPQAMPGHLPPTSAYTYAVELSADEAVTQGVKLNGKDVLLNQPVIFYVENFLNFPVGGIVPVGYYDNTQAAWAPSDNGRVIKVLTVTNGLANLDVTGSGTAADAAALAPLGITDAERQELATFYGPGQSLWRAPLSHLSTWDANWGMGCRILAGQVACQGPTMLAGVNKDLSCATPYPGSIIACQNQTLGEARQLAGTPFQLHYESDRTPGRLAANTVTIPLSGASLPAGVEQIVLEVAIAGRQFTQQFPALPNQTATFTWDALDAYGRRPQGEQPITVRLGYTYPAVYQTPAQLTRSFGYNGGGFITGSRARQEVTFWQVLYDTLGTWDARGLGLGGWTLDVHHAYDPVGRVLHEGTGWRRAAHDVGWVMTTVAGTGTTGVSGDGGPATQAQLANPGAVAVDEQGALFLADMQGSNRVRRVNPDGIITTVAGTGTAGYSGDGGPATQAQLNFEARGGAVAVDGQGNLFIADRGNHRIRKVSPDGSITTVAGTGVAGFSGDGGLATSAQFNFPGDMVVGRGGSLIIVDWKNHRIRQVSPDGIVTTVAGTGIAGFSGDGGPATQAQLFDPTQVAADAQGDLFIADQGNHRIRKVSAEGLITTVAGTGVGGFAGDGGPATSAQLNFPTGVVVDRQGSLFITDIVNNRIRKVSPDANITTVAGTGAAAFSGDGGPVTAAALNSPSRVAVDAQGTLVIADFGNRRIRRVAPFLPEFTAGDISIASEDGGEFYVFDPSGRHLRTLHALTGVIRYQFGYDAQGRLITITDGDSNVTTIQRDGAGQPTAIVAPDGQRTTFTLDPNGYLATITNPAGEVNRSTYSADGLLTTLTTPRGHIYSFTHDALGRLTRDEDPANGLKTLDRTEAGTSYTVTLTTALNRVSTYLVEKTATGSTHRVDTAPDGTRTDLLIGTDASRHTSAPDGTLTTLTQGPDPRFGMQAPVPSSLTLRMPSGLTSTLTTSRSVTLTDPNNFLSLSASSDSITLNGRTATRTYSASTKTFTDQSPGGRQVTTTIDAQGRVLRELVTGLEPVSFTYDPRGRLSTVAHGTGAGARTSTFAYNPEGFLETITDPLNRTVRFAYDLAGRVTTQTLPDLRQIRTTYDGNGNVTSVTPPSRPAHTFHYTPIDLESTYTPPDLGIGNVATTYTYNADRQLTQVTRPDGQTIGLGYDPGGRLDSLTAPTGPTAFTYHPTTGQLTRISAPGGVVLSYTYDGILRTGTTWAGPVAGSVTQTYNNDFRIATETVNGGNTISVQYDPDGLLTQAGSLTLTRHPQHGLLTGTSLAGVNDSYNYSTFGELSSYAANYSGRPLLDIGYTRDSLGRITQKAETFGGAATTTTYGYDQSGRLTDVSQDGTLLAHYEYDGNGNRLSVTRSGTGTVFATYDAQDRLVTYGAVNFTYTANGDLRTAISGGQSTTYDYDLFGNLTAATLSTGTQIEYVVDGQNRRIGKKVNGSLTQGFLYSGQLRPVAEMDGTGTPVSRFVYGTKVNVPEYMIKGGTTYRLLTDHLGSVRFVVETSTGVIAQRLDYDEFGQTTQDTNPGFQPFGFAGGLYDEHIKLTRFGARDYDAFTGRWTTKDPIGFAGGDVNRYGYVLNDPLYWVDPEGLLGAVAATLPMQGAGTAAMGGGAGAAGLAPGQPLTPAQWQQMKEDLSRWFDPRPLGQYLSNTAEEIIKEIKGQYEKRLKESKCEVRTPSQLPPKKHDPNDPPDPDAPWWKKLFWALGQIGRLVKYWPK